MGVADYYHGYRYKRNITQCMLCNMTSELGYDPFALPNIVERKGSLYLRSRHMKYGRSTLNSSWYIK